MASPSSLQEPQAVKHSPLPWRRGSVYPRFICAAGIDGAVAQAMGQGGATNEANAALIVHRVNTYDELLALLKDALRHTRVHPGSVWRYAQEADAAIRKAEGTTDHAAL